MTITIHDVSLEEFDRLRPSMFGGSREYRKSSSDQYFSVGDIRIVNDKGEEVWIILYTISYPYPLEKVS